MSKFKYKAGLDTLQSFTSKKCISSEAPKASHTKEMTLLLLTWSSKVSGLAGSILKKKGKESNKIHRILY